jgi:hypothetical protein
MPFARNKVLINCNTTEGSYNAIMSEYATLKELTGEILDGGWIAETGAIEAQMQTLCDAHNAADAAYLAGLQEIGTALHDFIKAKHAPPKP